MGVITLSPKYKVDLAVERRAHFYDVTLDGDSSPKHRFPGVTGYLGVINKPALVPWAKREALLSVERALLKRLGEERNINGYWIEEILKEARQKPDKIKDEASDLGTQAHAFIDLIIHGKEPAEVPMFIQAPVMAFQKWWKNSGIELVMGDTKVASLIHKYGGSLDALGRREGQFIILDWKTANGIYSEYALQVAAYAKAFSETYGIFVQEGIIVRFGKNPPIEFEARSILNLDKSFDAFIHARNLKQAMDQEHLSDSSSGIEFTLRKAVS